MNMIGTAGATGIMNRKGYIVRPVERFCRRLTIREDEIMEVELWVAVDSEGKMVSYARFIWALYETLSKDELGNVVRIDRAKAKIDYKPRNDLPF